MPLFSPRLGAQASELRRIGSEPLRKPRLTKYNFLSTTPAGGRNAQILLTKFLFLLLGMYFSKHLCDRFPLLWIVCPIFVAVLLSSAHFAETEKSAVRFLQLLGLLSAAYSLFNYPLIPLVNNDRACFNLYIVIWVTWILSVAAGIAGLRIPSLSIIPPAFLLWSKAAANAVTGVPYPALDVLPLPEVAMCLAGGLFINQIYEGLSTLYGKLNKSQKNTINRTDAETPRREFAGLVLLTAIAIHMANYFWSFWAKASLPDASAALLSISWLSENNPAYIFLSALDNDHIAFSAYPNLVAVMFNLLDKAHLLSNVGVFLIQGAAIAAFWIPKRWLLILLILFDLMHLSILVIVGANFWPWILLNVVIAYIVARADFKEFAILPRLLATIFILLAPRFVHVAYLGWYDTKANNKVFFEAVDDKGVRHYVPSNFFAFSSYFFSCMSCVADRYGVPAPETAFATLTNGGTFAYGTFKAGLACDLNALYGSGLYNEARLNELAAFVKAYHRMVLGIESVLGDFPYNFYPHHFFVPRVLTRDFDGLDGRQIVAYIFVRESACLQFSSGRLQRDVKSVGEYRIDVRPATGYQ